MRQFSALFDGEEPFEFFENTEDIAVDVKSEGLRMIYSFCGLYTTALDNDISISFPEEMLKRYQKMGVNAIWLLVILYQVTEFPFDKKYSSGYEKRQEKLRQLVALGEKYGIKIYLYLNEPGSMPLEFFDNYPKLLGKQDKLVGALGTSDKRVLQYVENAVETLCRAVPEIGGFFTITMSENLTHCKSRGEEDECEKCKDTPIYKLITDVMHAISRGIRKVDENIKLIVWTWSWKGRMSDEEFELCIKICCQALLYRVIAKL